MGKGLEMKGNKFLIIGGLVVAGIIAYEIYKHYCSETNKQSLSPSEDEDDLSTELRSVPPTDSPVSDFCQKKETAIASVKGRHSEAGETIKESLNTIFEENNAYIETENSKKLDDVSAELDELLQWGK